LLDVKGYYQPLVAFLDHAVEEGFVSALHRQLILIDTDPGALLDRFAAWEAPTVEKWVDQRGA
jgi:predicted Rossmann-fold nucleotide-binding protein